MITQREVNAIVAEMRRIGSGDLRSANAQQLVDAARDPQSSCHSIVFNRSVREAAEIYYENRARYLLRAIDVVYEEDGEEVQTRAFHAVYEDEDEPSSLRNYGVAGRVFRSPTRAQVVADARRELTCWVNQYEEYTYLAGAIRRVRAILRNL